MSSREGRRAKAAPEIDVRPGRVIRPRQYVMGTRFLGVTPIKFARLNELASRDVRTLPAADLDERESLIAQVFHANCGEMVDGVYLVNRLTTQQRKWLGQLNLAVNRERYRRAALRPRLTPSRTIVTRVADRSARLAARIRPRERRPRSVRRGGARSISRSTGDDPEPEPVAHSGAAG